MSRSHWIRVGALVLLGGLSGRAAAQADILIVDDNGGAGVDYTQISDAIAAAPDFGAVQVRSGNYASFVIDGRSLVVSAAPGATVNVLGAPGVDAIVVRNLAAGQMVILEGLKATGVIAFFGGNGSTSARVQHCAGLVWFQHCTLTSGADPVLNSPGLDVVGGAQTVVTRCTLKGEGFTDSGEAPGLRCEQSQVFVYESTITGGGGEHIGNFGPNAPGARVIGGRLFAEGSSITGGSADGLANPLGGSCIISHTGGPGLLLQSGAQAVMFDTTVLGGQLVPFGECASAGVPTIIESGTLETVPGSSLQFDMTTPLKQGDTATISFQGTPGDQAITILSVPGSAFYTGAFKGAWTAGSAPIISFLGPLPPSGQLVLHTVLPNLLQPGTAGELVMQGAFQPPAGKARLGDPIAVFIYDP